MLDDEFSLIQYLNEKQHTSADPYQDVVVGIGDDAAVTNWPVGAQVVMTCDAMVEGVHFVRDWHELAAQAVGYKALASTISDIAAMGGVPKYVTVTLAVPKQTSRRWLRQMYDGMYQCANKYQVAIVGGDTVSTKGPLLVSLHAVGMIPAGQQPLCRSAAQDGDVVFITNELGVAAAGLHRLLSYDKAQDGTRGQRGERWLIGCARLTEAHLFPEPQCAAGRLFGESRLVHALNDISDGLASEAWELAEASKLGIVLERAKLPVHWALQMYADDAAVQRDAYEWMFYGGEDYQLVGTVAEANWSELEMMCSRHNLKITAIGRVSQAVEGVVLLEADGSQLPLAKKGYNHFADGVE
jgi:thiamine-monophosphate kinase